MKRLLLSFLLLLGAASFLLSHNHIEQDGDGVFFEQVMQTNNQIWTHSHVLISYLVPEAPDIQRANASTSAATGAKNNYYGQLLHYDPGQILANAIIFAATGTTNNYDGQLLTTTAGGLPA
jgi:hypothetical protein